MENGQLIEQVVKKGRSAKSALLTVLIILAAIAIPAMILVIGGIARLPLGIIALFAFLFCIYGAWYFISSLKIEFEYAFLPTTLRIDKVIAKRRRKNIVKIDVKSLDDLFRYSDEEMTKRRFNRVVCAAEKEYSEENYVIAYHDAVKGNCAVIFAPDERLLEGMKPYCTGEVRKKLYGIKK